MNRTEKRLAKLSSDRTRLMQRIAKAEQGHKTRKDLLARLVDTTRLQIRTELALERKKNAA